MYSRSKQGVADIQRCIIPARQERVSDNYMGANKKKKKRIRLSLQAAINFSMEEGGKTRRKPRTSLDGASARGSFLTVRW